MEKSEIYCSSKKPHIDDLELWIRGEVDIVQFIALNYILGVAIVQY